MLALHPCVVTAIWAAVEPRLPKVVDEHPLGCHRSRLDDFGCFEAILFRLVTGCSWDVAGRLGKGSETTLRRRRDEWWEAGVFDGLVDEILSGYDRIIGLDLSDVAVDGDRPRPRSVVREPARTLSIVANADGSGRSRPNATGSQRGRPCLPRWGTR